MSLTFLYRVIVTEHYTGVLIPPYQVLLLLHQLQFPHELLPLGGSFPAQAGAALLQGAPEPGAGWLMPQAALPPRNAAPARPGTPRVSSGCRR